MGNCQAIDAASLIIHHPCGKIERKYYSVTAREVMKMNPGHYVSHIVPLPTGAGDDNSGDTTFRFTGAKLLRPSDPLVLGRAYRLVSSHDVMKVLRAKRHDEMKKVHAETMVENHSSSDEVLRYERILRQRPESLTSSSLSRSSPSPNAAILRSKSWCPSLQSISETSS